MGLGAMWLAAQALILTGVIALGLGGGKEKSSSKEFLEVLG